MHRSSLTYICVMDACQTINNIPFADYCFLDVKTIICIGRFDPVVIKIERVIIKM